MDDTKCKCISCRHTQTDATKCKSNCQSRLIQRALYLLTDRITQKCYDQHFYIISTFTKSCTNGYYLTDLYTIAIVMSVIHKRRNRKKAYRLLLKQLLENAARDVVIRNFMDINPYLYDVRMYYYVLGSFIIDLKAKHLRRLVYKGLLKLFTPGEGNFILKDIRTRHAATVWSNLPSKLSTLLKIIPDYEYETALKLISTAISFSDTVFALQMIKSGIVNNLLLLLVENREDNVKNFLNITITTKQYLCLELICDILNHLGKLFQHLNETDQQKAIPDNQACWALAGLLRASVTQSPANLVRNKLGEFIVTSLYALPHIPFYKWCFANDISLLISFPYVYPPGVWFEKVILLNTTENFDFLKMMLSTLFLVEKYPEMIEFLEKNSVLIALLEQTKSCNACSCKDCINFTKFAYTALYFVGPGLVDSILRNKVLERLFAQLGKKSLAQDPSPDTTIRLLQILVKLTHINDDRILMVLNKAFYLTKLKEFCETIYSKDNLDVHDQKVLSYLFSLMKKLHTVDKVSKVNPVATIRNYFHRVTLRKPCDTNYIQLTLVAAFHFLWDLFQQSDTYRCSFTLNGGIYVLIDALQMSGNEARLVGLACLLEISEWINISDYIENWPGGASKRNNFIKELITLFAPDKTEPSFDLSKLEGEIQARKYEKAKNSSSFNSTEFIEACRVRAAAFMKLLQKFTNFDESYEIYPHQLDFAVFTDKYFPYKIAQAWADIYRNLNQTNLVLSSIDIELKEYVQRKLKNWMKETVKETGSTNCVREQAKFDFISKSR